MPDYEVSGSNESYISHDDSTHSNANTEELRPLDEDPKDKKTRLEKLLSVFHKICNKVCNFKHLISSSVAFLLFLVAIFFRGNMYNFKFITHNIEAVSDISTTSINQETPEALQTNMFFFRDYSIGKLICFLSLIVVLNIVLTLLIRYTIYIIINYMEIMGIKWYIFMYCSQHVSVGIICIALLVIIKKNNFNLCIPNFFYMELCILDIISTILFTNTLFSVGTVIATFLNITFNKNTFSGRVFNLIKADYFISFITSLSENFKNIEELNDIEDREFLYLKTLPVLNTKEKLETADKKSKIIHDAFFQSRDDVIFESVNDWVYMSYIKQSKNALFTEKADNLDTQNPKKKHTMKLKAIRKLTRYGLYKIDDLNIFFDEKIKLSNILNNIGINPNTELDDNRFFWNFMLKTKRENINIKKSMGQINNAINTLQKVFYCIIIILVFAYIGSTLCGTTTIALSILSAFFGTGFIFQSSVKNAVDSIIFLFCIHPFDVGDRVFIKVDGVQANLVVKELNIFSTEFTNWDGTTTYIPNSLLCTQIVSNIRRSFSMAEFHNLEISSSTKKSDIELLEDRIKSYLKNNNGFCSHNCILSIESIENSNKINMKIIVYTKKNWQAYEEYLKIKKELLLKIHSILQELKIEYKLPVQRIKICPKDPIEATDKNIQDTNEVIDFDERSNDHRLF